MTASTRPSGWTAPAINPALAAAADRADRAEARANAAEREAQQLTDQLAELRRRHHGALYLVRNADAAAGAGHTAVLLADLRLLLESSRDNPSNT